ncbi:hypothetical protein REPUB_Repub14bG0002200 [Reevesia pubescens]
MVTFSTEQRWVRTCFGLSEEVLVQVLVSLWNGRSTWFLSLQKVTAFNVPITLQQGASTMIDRWQQIAYRLPKDLFVRILLTVGKESDGTTTVKAIFNSLYLGPLHKLLPLIHTKFPELGQHLQEEHCTELNWIESVLFLDRGFAQGRNDDVLMDRSNILKGFFTAKSDFVKKPITKSGLEAIWKIMQEKEAGMMIWEPYGGKMEEIAEDATPFPHRAGTLYNFQYYSNWKGGDAEKKRRDWISKLYNFMEPYVSHYPRASYLNYRDLSLGMNSKCGSPSHESAKVWGEKYFKHNFERLGRVKLAVDPGNFFRNEQSIPPYSGHSNIPWSSALRGEKYFEHNFERLGRVKLAVDPGNFFRNEQSIPPYSGN